MTAPEIWRQPFTVRAYEVGPDERAPLLTVADYFQEAAGEHARSGDVEMRETVEVETWPSGYDRLKASRDYRLRGADGQPLVVGTSAWLVLDVARRRPVRLPDVVLQFGPRDPEHVMTFGDAPAPPTSVEESAAFTVRRSDLDRVGHANNVRFLEWTLEALPTDAGLREIEVVYKSEAVAGDEVVSEAGPMEDGQRSHRLSRASDGRTLAFARTTWTS